MDLEFIRGDTFRFKFKIKDKEGKEIKPTEDSFQLYFTVKKSNRSEDVIIQKTLINGIEYNAEDEYYHVEITSEDTSNLNYGSYVYDIELKSETIVKTLIIGQLTLTEEVTFGKDEV